MMNKEGKEVNIDEEESEKSSIFNRSNRSKGERSTGGTA